MFGLANTPSTVKVSSISSLILSTILILSAASSAMAQGVGSSRGLPSGDGIHTIQGRVHFPSGQSTGGVAMKVSLESISAVGAMSTATDLDGAFRFTGLEAGGYTVVVDAGKQYEIARESVNIDREASPGGRIVQVVIQLRLKGDGSNPTFAGIPQDALDFYQKGAAAAQKGNAKSATDFLSKAVAAYPNFPLALRELGMQYTKLLQWDNASETFEELLKLKPSDVVAHLNLGIALYNLGIALVNQQKLDEAQKKLDGAEAQLREAIKLNSPGPTAHYYLALTLIKFRAYDDAQKELELVIANGGENLAQAHRYLGGLYQSAHKNKEAADELEKYLKLDPKVADAERIQGIIKDLRSKQ
jgi:tetratricopeptide (TPR) repeat protein